MFITTPQHKNLMGKPAGSSSAGPQFETLRCWIIQRLFSTHAKFLWRSRKRRNWFVSNLRKTLAVQSRRQLESLHKNAASYININELDERTQASKPSISQRRSEINYPICESVFRALIWGAVTSANKERFCERKKRKIIRSTFCYAKSRARHITNNINPKVLSNQIRNFLLKRDAPSSTIGRQIARFHAA